ncbi:MAG: radical SAM family heme chaperone HemW [Clostridia bacterium]|nr:radical SAM family heme chaperone HemW [Clostridia bacterium]
MKPLGIYLHIPFCRSKCLYCDFCSIPHPNSNVIERYVKALCRDLEARAGDCRGYEVDTVYFGGGTPSLLPPDLLLRVLETLVRCYHVASGAEITLECNPATANMQAFADLRQGGFNRLSIGLQSTHENELRALGRIHSFADFERTFADARRAGFANISADLMSGIPLQTVKSYLQSIERLVTLGPEHISAYGLSVEEGTPFFKMQERLALPDEEAARDMYFRGIELLQKHGYGQYEISNFARCGYESRHNLKYWNCDEYLGFGVAAYSDFDGDRFGNSHDLSAYIEGESIECERETPSPSTRMNEYVMLRMRLCEGVFASAFEARFGGSFAKTFGMRLARYEKQGLIRFRGEDAAFTPEGFYLSNAILSELLDFSN